MGNVLTDFLGVRKALTQTQDLMLAKVGLFLENGLKLTNIESKARGLAVLKDPATERQAEAILAKVTALRSTQTAIMSDAQSLMARAQGLQMDWNNSPAVTAISKKPLDVKKLLSGSGNVSYIKKLFAQGKTIVDQGSQALKNLEKQNAEVQALEESTDKTLKAAGKPGLAPAVRDILQPILGTITAPIGKIGLGLGLVGGAIVLLYMAPMLAGRRR